MKSYLGRDNQACSSSIRTESKDREGNKKRGKNRGEKRNTKETQCEETEAEASLPRRRGLDNYSQRQGRLRRRFSLRCLLKTGLTEDEMGFISPFF